LSSADTTRSLTGKEQAFVDYYLGESRFNATDAARKAGYKGNDVTLASVGYENLRKPKITSEISRRMNEHCASANEVLDVLTTQMRGSIVGVIRATGDVELADKLEAAGVDRLLKKHKIRRSIRTTREGETVEDVTHEFEIHDPQAAAVHVGKYHKLFAERTEVTGKDGGPIRINKAEELTDDELAGIASR